MTAIQLVNQRGGVLRDPVMEITDRIERARSRLRRERGAERAASAERTYPLFDAGRLVGSIEHPHGAPAFGPGAAAVLLRREA